jgi:alpha-L-arabinofuranosidase
VKAYRAKKFICFQKVELLTFFAAILFFAKATAQTNVVVSFATANPTPLNLGFAGYCTELGASSVEYYDTNFQQAVAPLSPGWLRYPGGAVNDAFSWTNGLTLTNWFSNFTSAETNLLWAGAKIGNSKGGLKFGDFAAMCQNVGGAKIVVTINGFTDSANSAGAFAAYALSNHIPVAAWELCNEPYVFTGSGGLAAGDFFLNATNYVTLMKPYRDAIKAADSNAVVAIYFNDAGVAEPNGWDENLKLYTNKYWDAVAYHHYPVLPTIGVTFAGLMARDNWELASNTTARLQNYLIPDNNPSVTFIISEFLPARGDGAGGNYPPTATLYGAIYTAEYLMRMSTLPQMRFVGQYQVLNAAGIAQTNNEYQPVTTAYNGGYTTNTAGLPFGFFQSAQVCGSSIANWALYRSVATYATTVGTNCPTVPAADSSDVVTPIPAIYAQAYQGGNGKRYVVLTNKGTNAVPVQIKQDGVVLTNSFLETYVTGSDPSATNSSPQNSQVQIKTVTVTNSVTIPEYSVVRLEWTVSNVPPTTLAVTISNQIQNLHWLGNTNCIYNVQGVTNLLGTWITLGRVANTTTNFGFTNWNAGQQQFYRLGVP